MDPSINNMSSSSTNELLINNSTGAQEEDEWAKIISYQLDVIFDGYAVVIVGIFGTIFNLLSIIVLLQPKMRVLSINILLIGLQISDLFLVISIVCRIGLPAIVYSINPDSNYFKYSHLIYFVSSYIQVTTLLCSRYFTILVTIERYIAVCHPLQAVSLLRPRRAIYGSIIVTIFSIIFCIPLYLAVALSFDEDTSRYTVIKTAFRASTFYQKYNVYIQSVVCHVIPLATLIILNAAICRQVRKSVAAKTTIRTNNVNNDTEKSLTFLLFAIVLTFFMCNIFLFIYDLTTFYYDKIPIWKLLFISPFTMFFVVVNSSVNFIFYCVFGTKFRIELLNVLNRYCICQKGLSLLRTSKQTQSTDSDFGTTTTQL